MTLHGEPWNGQTRLEDYSSVYGTLEYRNKTLKVKATDVAKERAQYVYMWYKPSTDTFIAVLDTMSIGFATYTFKVNNKGAPTNIKLIKTLSGTDELHVVSQGVKKQFKGIQLVLESV